MLGSSFRVWNENTEFRNHPGSGIGKKTGMGTGCIYVTDKKFGFHNRISRSPYPEFHRFYLGSVKTNDYLCFVIIKTDGATDTNSH